ncbi:hypothetical protein CCY99_04385 [Helicobacter sp. 16-1353]|uniref:DUF1090 family protein n=1 Tax=Helicobacter sp. 16-1353 TaxID=2004996 RepID=UPI000DCC7232|nr:DUF1090 family protein [Helicobacter sp. 16-1353]RAX54255.1 hypothetical protein CCY99_04385 [Helicobacter sp. 16-1353]
MYKILTMSILAFGLLSANSISDTCQNKIDDIEKQIKIAEQFGQSSKIDGLKNSLAAVKAKCEDGSISNELKSKISKYENKIKETQSDIEAAKAKGKTLKVKAEEAKLKVLQGELEEAKKDLENLVP